MTPTPRKCTKCRKNIPAARLAALPHTWRCVNCSDVKKVQGLMDFSHKTAPALVILPDDPEQQRLANRAFHRSR